MTSTLDGPPTLDEVRYVACPQCHNAMNRVNFGRVSGVIVDVCKMHGTWFDAGELTRLVAFAGSGGLARTRAREKLDQHEERASRPRAPDPVVPFTMLDGEDRARLDLWRDFLLEVFRW